MNKGPLEAHAVVFWAAVEHIVDYLVYCRRAAGASLQVYQLSAMDHQAAAAVSSDRVHNKNSSLGMWQKSRCDKKDSWQVWQLLQQLWFGSCSAASVSAAIIIGFLCTQEQKWLPIFNGHIGRDQLLHWWTDTLHLLQR